MTQDEEQELELLRKIALTARETIAYYGREHSRVTRRLNTHIENLDLFKEERKRWTRKDWNGKEL